MKRNKASFAAYDVFVGILYNFPKRKKRFSGTFIDIMNFIETNLKELPSLNRFTRNQLYSGLDTFLSSKMIKYDFWNSNIKRFDTEIVAVAYERINNAGFFGEEEKKELKDLSRKFFEKFR